MSNERIVTAHAGEQSIAFSREFEASAALVFAAHTDATLVAQWTGPRGTRFCGPYGCHPRRAVDRPAWHPAEHA